MTGEQRRIGFHWHLRKVMAAHNLWKSTDLRPLLQSRGVNLSDAQIYRLVTTEPQRISSHTLAALCDIFDCSPGDLFEPFVEMRAAKTAQAPSGRALGLSPGPCGPIAHRIRVVEDSDGPTT
jgi:DNA-binding Xre family transcriptional regulator